MSEFSLPPNTTKANFLSLLLSDFFFFFCSFIISHPLYFSYFIFFSPYIIKILSFLSPLFITTSLLLLSLFTTFLRSNNNNAGDANYGQQLLVFEDLEAYYKIVFDTSSSFQNIQEDEVSEEKEEEEEEGLIPTSEAPVDKHMCHGSNQLTVEGNTEVKSLRVDELKNVDETSNKAMEKVRVDSQRFDAGEGDDDGDEHLWSDESEVGLYKTQSFGSSLGSYGSMRKEKEWRRTLACKLFEERHNNNVEESDEGMDMLWETYEADSNKKQQQKQQKKQQQLAKSKTNKGNKWSKYKHHDDDGDEEEEIDDDDDGQLCCLQALKFSAGKMNLGMGRPNLVKISKAFKGIGWLHGMTKHGKKIYH